MKTRKGDLVALAKQGEYDVIVHGCNCFCSMDAGIARQIKQQFPEAYAADMETHKGDRDKLGTISYAHCNNDIDGHVIVVNGYTQYDYKGEHNADYDAIEQVFVAVKEKFSAKKIAYPAIGAGLAGGDWATIANIIEEALNGEDHTFIEFQK